MAYRIGVPENGVWRRVRVELAAKRAGLFGHYWASFCCSLPLCCTLVTMFSLPTFLLIAVIVSGGDSSHRGTLSGQATDAAGRGVACGCCYFRSSRRPQNQNEDNHRRSFPFSAPS